MVSDKELLDDTVPDGETVCDADPLEVGESFDEKETDWEAVDIALALDVPDGEQEPRGAERLLYGHAAQPHGKGFVEPAGQ